MINILSIEIEDRRLEVKLEYKNKNKLKELIV